MIYNMYIYYMPIVYIPYLLTYWDCSIKPDIIQLLLLERKYHYSTPEARLDFKTATSKTTFIPHLILQLES